jgi:hypothetical protein
MMLAGALARIADPNGEGIFAIKGGVAMELRMGDRARATRDVDLIMRGDPTRLAALLDDGLREPYGGFSLRRDALGDLPSRPQVKKTRVEVSFAGRSLTTLHLEIAPPDTATRSSPRSPVSPSRRSACRVRTSCSSSPSAGRSRRSCTQSASSSPTDARTPASAISSTCSCWRRSTLTWQQSETPANASSRHEASTRGRRRSPCKRVGRRRTAGPG